MMGKGRLYMHLSSTVIAGLVAVVVPNLPAGAQEQRCDELGSACICSEPFNVAQSIPSRSSVDPADSSSKECQSAPFYNAGSTRAISDNNLPLASNVQFVWELTTHGGDTVANITADMDIPSVIPTGTRRICHRYYRRFSNDFPKRIAGNDRTKIQEFQILNFMGQYQMEDRGGGSLGGFFNIGQPAIDYSLAESGSLNIDDCRTNWCRFEQCLVGDFDNGRNIAPVARFTQILSDGSIGKQKDMVRPSGKPLLNTNSQVQWGNVWIANLYREGNLNGVSSVSHAMVAAWHTDEGQFIGGAYEIEGAGAGSGGPAPPQLLPQGD